MISFGHDSHLQPGGVRYLSVYFFHQHFNTMKQTFTKLFCAVLLLTAGMATAQTPFYSENFTNGFPTGWTTTDTSSNGVLWEYCVGPSSACVNLYGNADFASTTAGGGFMVLDSDGAGELGAGNQHISQLTTGAVNCTGAAEVFVTFENYVGVFATASTGTVLLRVSTNGTTWTEFDVIPGLTQNNRFSSNPYLATFDISSIAANQSVVY